MDNSTPNMSEKLARYLDGELPGNEKQGLEQQLVSDVALQQEYDSLLMTREAVRYYGLQQKVKGIHSEVMQELKAPVRTISPIKRFVKISIAVAASILLLVGGYLAYNFFTLSPEKVFASNYKGYELSTLRNNNPQETAAEKAFKEKNYAEIVRIHDAGEDHTQKGEFLCGIAALELKNNSKAISCFNEVIDANKKASAKIMNDDAEYYLSLSYIQNEDYDFALDLLRKIKNDPEHIYHEKVNAKLIREVKMLKWR